MIMNRSEKIAFCLDALLILAQRGNTVTLDSDGSRLHIDIKDENNTFCGEIELLRSDEEVIDALYQVLMANAMHGLKSS